MGIFLQSSNPTLYPIKQFSPEEEVEDVEERG